MSQISFDTSGFLRDHFRDADGVVGLVGKHFAEAPKREAVRKWFARRAIPADWWPVIIVTVERERGAPAEVARYFTPGGWKNDVFA